MLERADIGLAARTLPSGGSLRNRHVAGQTGGIPAAGRACRWLPPTASRQRQEAGQAARSG